MRDPHRVDRRFHGAGRYSNRTSAALGLRVRDHSTQRRSALRLDLVRAPPASACATRRPRSRRSSSRATKRHVPVREPVHQHRALPVRTLSLGRRRDPRAVREAEHRVVVLGQEAHRRGRLGIGEEPVLDVEELGAVLGAKDPKPAGAARRSPRATRSGSTTRAHPSTRPARTRAGSAARPRPGSASHSTLAPKHLLGIQPLRRLRLPPHRTRGSLHQRQEKRRRVAERIEVRIRPPLRERPRKVGAPVRLLGRQLRRDRQQLVLVDAFDLPGEHRRAIRPAHHRAPSLREEPARPARSSGESSPASPPSAPPRSARSSRRARWGRSREAGSTARSRDPTAPAPAGRPGARAPRRPASPPARAEAGARAAPGSTPASKGRLQARARG